MSKPLLLLAAPSHESQDKAAHLHAAAQQLGVPARIVLGERAEAVEAAAGEGDLLLALACSDALATSAARLNERHGCGGLSVALMRRLADKATAIPMLSEILDLPLLPQCLPRTPDDVLRWSWSGPIFVKPTQSSGGWSPRPWGYRTFDSKSHFLSWLADEGLEADFFAEQRQPATLGPAMLQAALDGSRTEGALLLLAPSSTYIVSSNYCYFESLDGDSANGPRWRRAIYQDELAADFSARLPRLDRVRHADAAWGRGLLHLQCIRGPEGLHLIDVNLRLTTTWDSMAAAADPSTHRRLLAALLFDVPFAAALPSPAIGIDLVNAVPGRRICSIEHPPLPSHILPVRLKAEECGRPNGGFDKAGVMPSFVTLAADLQGCIVAAEAFRAELRITYSEKLAQ